jgi:hypothetical protein
MDNEKSPIHSMNVSLGTPQTVPASAVSSNQPWVILVCSDLGFTSHRPQKISSATLNELLTSTEIIISGTVEKGLPDEIAPFHIEYPIDSLKDFSPSSIAEKLPYLQDLKKAAEVLNAISAKKIAPSDGLKKIAAMTLPPSVVSLLGTIGPVSAGGVKTKGHSSPQAPKKIDSILSMMDIEEDEHATSPQEQPSDFVAAITEGGAAQQEISQAALHNCIQTVDGLLESLGNIVSEQPFFTAATSSWNALKIVLKIAGRNRDTHFYLHSAPYDAAERHFGDALAVCAAETGTPDLVVWDYPVPIDTATMEQFSHIGEQADHVKTVVAASIDRHDELYTKILDGEPLKGVLEKPAFIPLRRLQEAAQARCLVLCCPDAIQQRGQNGKEIKVAGAWLFTFQWTSSLVENSSPFHLQNSSIQVLDSFAFPKLSREVATDTYQNGITLLRPNSITTPRVLFGDHETPYGSLLFNLLVNRTARLAADWISGQNKSVSLDAAAPALQHFLLTELSPYHILSSDEAVSVEVSGLGSLVVTINSTVTVAGFPVQFQFSFNYRE